MEELRHGVLAANAVIIEFGEREDSLSFVPLAEIRQLRDYTRLRTDLARERTGITPGWRNFWKP